MFISHLKDVLYKFSSNVFSIFISNNNNDSKYDNMFNSILTYVSIYQSISLT
jgi:hypothetical protein